MRKEHKIHIAQWIKALRSKKYKQTKSHLKDDYGYCCLGVACEISGLGTWTNTALEYMAFKPKTMPFVAASSSLPFVVSQWLGFDGISNPVLAKGLDGENDEIDAIEANDELNWSFRKIANALEKKYLKGTTANEVLKNA